MKKSDIEFLHKSGIAIFGDLEFSGESLPESAEMLVFFQLLKEQVPDLAAVAFHVRNEGKKSRFAGFKQKQEGMLTGAADIVIPCSPPICIELKRKNHRQSQISGKQIEFLTGAKKVGAFACVALGAEAALEAVKIARKE